MPVISAALFARFASRQVDSPAMKVIAALRNQFGGHAVTTG
jgi:6-phosphogluconate dehydrogenase